MDLNWIDQLRQLSKEQSGPLVATLATVSMGKRGPLPQARSVVIRNISDEGWLTFTSDARSEKENQLAEHPQAVLVIWLTTPRVQFRVAGLAHLLPAESADRLAVWKKMSDAARATFTWPTPGDPKSPIDRFGHTVAPDVDPPESFDVWTVEPETVETLDLRPHPHLRKRWNRSPNLWAVTEINP